MSHTSSPKHGVSFWPGARLEWIVVKKSWVSDERGSVQWYQGWKMRTVLYTQRIQLLPFSTNFLFQNLQTLLSNRVGSRTNRMGGGTHCQGRPWPTGGPTQSYMMRPSVSRASTGGAVLVEPRSGDTTLIAPHKRIGIWDAFAAQLRLPPQDEAPSARWGPMQSAWSACREGRPCTLPSTTNTKTPTQLQFQNML